MNRFSAQFNGGSSLRRSLRAFRWALVRPRNFLCLGLGTQIVMPLRAINPRCISIGDRVVIGRNCLLQPLTSYLDQQFSPNLRIGDDCYVGPDCQFHCIDRIELGRGCVLSDQVYVSDVGHGMDPRDGLLMDRPLVSKGPVLIEDGCFVGFASVLMSGVTLGAYCVVGARSVVTRSFPAYTMVAGNPARAIARFDHDAGKWRRINPALAAERS
jgi:acetyltransferase-like isoleucine patch superfamily enzyme